MAVSTMQAVSIIGLTRDIDNVISVLGESGVFHPDDVSSFYSNTKDFTHLQSKNIYAEPLNTLKATLSLTKRKFNLVDVSDFNPTFKEIELFTNQINSDIEVLADDRLFVEEQLMQAKENLVETTHFVGLGVEIEKVLTLKYISSRFGRLPKESFEKLSAYKDNPYVDLLSVPRINHIIGAFILLRLTKPRKLTESFQDCTLKNVMFSELMTHREFI